MVSDTDCSVKNKVHLKDFFLFVIDDVLFFLIAKVPRLESEGHIVEEFAILVLLRIEKESEIVEDVIEQVVNDNATFDLPGQCVDELVVFLHLTESIVCPEVLKVLIDLPVE